MVVEHRATIRLRIASGKVRHYAARMQEFKQPLLFKPAPVWFRATVIVFCLALVLVGLPVAFYFAR
jgi:hypothetical protein